MTATAKLISYTTQEYAIIGIVVVVAIAIFFGLYKLIKEGIKTRKELLEELEKPQAEPQLFECKAVIVEKFCQIENKGSVRFPNSQECYYVVIKTPDEKLRKCSITQEKYLAIKEGQELSVALENDEIFDIFVE